jgi:hypothetical protein
VTVTAWRREIEVRGPDLPQGPEHRPRHARQMPHALELVEAAFVERLLDCGLQLIGRSRNREATGEPCGDLWQVQDLETTVVGLRRREAAHLERQRSLHHRGPECGKTIVAQFLMPLLFMPMDDNKKQVQNCIDAIQAAIILHKAANRLILTPQQEAGLQTHMATITGNFLSH